MQESSPYRSVSRAEAVNLDSYLKSQGVENFGEIVYISQKPARHSEEKTRHLIVTSTLGIFGGTVLLSGCLTAVMAFSGPEPDFQPIKDWTSMMMTTQAGFMGAACGYYFGSTQGKSED